MKKTVFIIWTWGSTVLFAGLIYWVATIPNFQAGTQVTDEFVKVVFRIVLYAILFILLYRSIILTLKHTVQRLATYRSRDEEAEDAEFVLIIETIVVVVCILACILFAFFEEHIQFYVPGRNGIDSYLVAANGGYIRSETISPVPGNTYINLNSVAEANKDVLVSTMSVILTGMVAYSLPVIGELEMAIKHKVEKEIKLRKSRKVSK